jgi:phosphoribosylformylglycinamidine synthase
MVEVQSSPSVLLVGMEGSRIPVPVAHGEGRAELQDGELAALEEAGLVALRYVDGRGAVAERYPHNPNGSPAGLTAVTTRDGRVTAMMPHPERLFRAVQHSYLPAPWGEQAPWLRMFRNARAFVA